MHRTPVTKRMRPHSIRASHGHLIQPCSLNVCDCFSQTAHLLQTDTRNTCISKIPSKLGFSCGKKKREQTRVFLLEENELLTNV